MSNKIPDQTDEGGGSTPTRPSGDLRSPNRGAAGEPPAGSDAMTSLTVSEVETEGRVNDRTGASVVATVAHQLKSPLGVSVGYLDLLLSERLGPLNERQRAVVGELRENSGRLLNLVQEFLTCAAFDTESISLKLEAGDLNCLLSELCGYWQDRFMAKGVMLYFPTNPNLPTLELDGFKIQQVVSNLLDNALNFTPTGGTVWLTVEPCLWERRGHPNVLQLMERRQTSSLTCNAVCATVADTGPGVAPEYLQEVFDDFFQVPGPEKIGTRVGLGLAIARRIVRAHGGRIWAESELGVGSKFCFVLPLTRERTSDSKRAPTGIP